VVGMRGKAFGETTQTVGSSYAAGYIELSRKRHQAPWRVERTAISMGLCVPLLEFNLHPALTWRPLLLLIVCAAGGVALAARRFERLDY